MNTRFIKEFKEFIARGNVIDLAVGIIIGAAFGKIVNSLVNDIVMPPIGLLLQGINFQNLFISLNGHHYATVQAAKTAGAATINYGNFITVTIEFLIVAASVFLVIKAISTLRHNNKAPVTPPPTTSETLLSEIRDLLKKKEESRTKAD